MPSLYRLSSGDGGSGASLETQPVGGWSTLTSQVTPRPGCCSFFPRSPRRDALGRQRRGPGCFSMHLGARSFPKKAANAGNPGSAVPPRGAGADTQFVFGCTEHAHMQIAAHSPSLPKSSGCRGERKKKTKVGGAEERRGEKRRKEREKRKTSDSEKTPEGGEKQRAGRPRLCKGRAGRRGSSAPPL